MAKADVDEDKKAGGQAFLASKESLIRLFCYAYNGSWEVFLTTLKSFADDPNDNLALKEVLMNTRDGRQWTALHFAAAGGNIDVIKGLLKIEPDLITLTDLNSISPLMLAIRHGDYAAVSELLKLTTSEKVLGCLSNKQESCLHFAAESGSVEITEKLLDMGADANFYCPFNGTPPYLALVHGHNKILKNFANYNLQLDNAHPSEMPPFLILASSSNNVDAVKLALETKVSTMVTDNEGWTALQCAAEAGAFECVNLLLEENKIIKNINYRNQNETALSLALKSGHKSIIKLLKEHGAQE